MTICISRTFLAFALGMCTHNFLTVNNLHMHDAGWWAVLVVTGVALAFLKPDEPAKPGR